MERQKKSENVFSFCKFFIKKNEPTQEKYDIKMGLQLKLIYLFFNLSINFLLYNFYFLIFNKKKRKQKNLKFL